VNSLVESILALDTRIMLIVFLLVLDGWAIWLIVRARPSRKEAVLWSAIVLLCPIVGCLLWYALGPKPVSGISASGG
jgi:hypothetical protein